MYNKLRKVDNANITRRLSRIYKKTVERDKVGMTPNDSPCMLRHIPPIVRASK